MYLCKTYAHIQTANALPKETSIKKKHCVDDFYANPKKLPCGMQYDNMQRRVWDSQVRIQVHAYVHTADE